MRLSIMAVAIAAIAGGCGPTMSDRVDSCLALGTTAPRGTASAASGDPMSKLDAALEKNEDA